MDTFEISTDNFKFIKQKTKDKLHISVNFPPSINLYDN